jgi:hypothetical protein
MSKHKTFLIGLAGLILILGVRWFATPAHRPKTPGSFLGRSESDSTTSHFEAWANRLFAQRDGGGRLPRPNLPQPRPKTRAPGTGGTQARAGSWS